MPLPPRLRLLRLCSLARHSRLALRHSTCFLLFKLPPLVAGNPIIFTWRADDVQSAHLVALASFVIATLVVTPSNRGRFLHWLNAKLRTGGTKAQEAASVPALLRR